MGITGKTQKNDDLAPIFSTKSLEIIGRLLSLVGKPFYILIISILVLAYITGYITRNFSTKIFLWFVALSKKLQKNTKGTISFLLSILNKDITQRKRGIKKGVVFKASKINKGQLAKIVYSFMGALLRAFLNTLRTAYILLKITILLPLEIGFTLLKSLLKLLFGTTINIILWTRKSLMVFVQNFKGRLAQLFSVTKKIKFPRIAKFKLISFVLLVFFLLGGAGSIIFWNMILKDLPSPDKLTQRQIDISTKIYDRNGILLYKIYNDKNRTLIKLEDVPKNVRLATIAIEDAEFYSHPGFSIRGIFRALVRNIKRKELTGGSTITQQLVKNALLSPEKTVIRKLRELTLAIQVELKYEKDEILEMYLNEVSYGGTAYGIQEAARMYFDKDVEKLTLGEAALLAGLPKSPTQYSPFGPNKDAAFDRQKEVLRLMKINGYITARQEKEALEERIIYAPNKIDIKAPHFVMYVRQVLEEKYGKELVEKGGLDVITSLDYEIQKLAEFVVRQEVEKLEKLNVSNGAVLITKPATGEILAMVGSRDYFDTHHDGNVNVITSPRQPGSSIKVINYAYALSNGYTPSTIVQDIPTTFNVEGQPPYTPKNYEGGFRGKLSLRSALAESRNVPAVRVLASYGVDKMFDLGKSMGITTWQNLDNYGLSLTLGGGEVKLIDLARVYSTIANYGEKPPITSVLKVTNFQGKTLLENQCPQEKSSSILAYASPLTKESYASESAIKTQEPVMSTNCGEQVLDPRVAYILTDILKDNRARSPAFGANSLLVIPNHSEVAVKTGTSNDLRDNLAIGYNQNYLVAVWVGNNDNAPMARIASGITGATPIFNKIMSILLTNEENHDWQIPNGLERVSVCTLTGTLACSGCPNRTEWFLEETKPDKTCSPEWFKEETKETHGGEILEPAAATEIVEENIYIEKKKKKPWAPIFNR